ncbi:MAG: MCE family protein [Candidatus Competibacteraceae bacterium]|nr:MCE family protein [Candidatus Competibacteraceae bacterium]MBK7984326.1 MCE family protein [Candidatus Competibacteraceae bacterium]MBK8896293.1 MCE family protein [Candidatus Competibacteraceae bacterium]MBK9950178.1 MCE family protein [Candidatus Competibacteraceae bacterium]
MLSKVNYMLVGLFVLLLGAALLGVVFWLTVGGEVKVYDRYRVYFQESVAGLNPKATVRYRGVQVGQVESIQLDANNPDQVDVVLDIERGTPIRRDTIATLSTRGLTGVASVELSSGRAQSPPLEKRPGQDLPVIQAGPSLVARLDDAFNNILTNVNNLSGRLERLLGDENQLALSEILRNVRTITGAAADRPETIQRTLTNLETFTSELVKLAQRLSKSLEQLASTLEKSGDLSAQVQTTLADFRASAQAVRKTAETFNQTSLALSGAAETGQQELRRLGQSTLPELNGLLVQVNDLVGTLQRLAELLEQNPRALLLGKPSGRPGPGEK